MTIRLAISKRNRLPTLLLMAVGVCALAYTGWQGWHMATFLHRATRTVGTIVDPSSHPRIRFTTAGGTAVEFVQNGFVSRPLGAAVPVAYMPEDPAGTAQAATIWTTWVTALWLLPMGLGFTLLPLFGAEAEWRPGRY